MELQYISSIFLQNSITFKMDAFFLCRCLLVYVEALNLDNCLAEEKNVRSMHFF